jgi:hypothetical protein
MSTSRWLNLSGVLHLAFVPDVVAMRILHILVDKRKGSVASSCPDIW